ncbi:hypothetical protein EYZ11_010801 [Aspergillus tanneri]|uniref:Inheritance of peroxisomes protein 1 n=1 Tax=Aspergillus tanneri TaxID=1220188 RepID=A0A4S3J4F7_9EURO|nr:uncharacterized protein ATNIH1004_005871 [Aspergillus tanneri]KAA8647181.1 hypothetical protein ATNIH1004_005871 [Aspergillus tanneri]THC89749.1 hypothetical protein EYZ11_010801 [Aspergillus tanneri]
MSDPSDAPVPKIQSIRRSATLPSKANPRLRRPSISLKPSENDLYFHPSAKVVHFAPRALAPIPSSTFPSDFDYPVDTVETLPWRSPTERTVAFAPLRLENVHGLTVFLKCGSVVHAILKNSQSWCVDGESTFVLRIRPLTYYRIELPNESDEDKELITAMKEVLPKILRYEVTPCPFKREFTVEIPEEAKAPRRKKKAWSPKWRRESEPIYLGYAKDPSAMRDEGGFDFLSAGEETDGNTTDGSGFTTRGSNSTTLETILDDNEPVGAPTPGLPISEPGEIPKFPRHSVTETQQSFQTLLARFEDRQESPVELDVALSSSVDSFHSAEHSFSTLPESGLYSNAPQHVSVNENDQCDSINCDEETLSDKSIFREVDYKAEANLPNIICHDCSSPALEMSTAPMSEQEPIPSPNISLDDEAYRNRGSTTSSDLSSNLSSMSIEFRRRSKASREREVSPMPPPSILALSRPTEKYDAASIIQKTCSLVLVPPIQLFIVLIHIAARIVIGPTVNSAMGDLDRKFECEITNPQEAVDDFGLPLTRECSRKRSVSEEIRKLDPWDRSE